MFTDSALDNLLVKQKNYILWLCNEGRYREAHASLNTVREFWTGCDYGYKIREMEERIAIDEAA